MSKLAILLGWQNLDTHFHPSLSPSAPSLPPSLSHTVFLSPYLSVSLPITPSLSHSSLPLSLSLSFPNSNSSSHSLYLPHPPSHSLSLSQSDHAAHRISKQQGVTRAASQPEASLFSWQQMRRERL